MREKPEILRKKEGERDWEIGTTEREIKSAETEGGEWNEGQTDRVTNRKTERQKEHNT